MSGGDGSFQGIDAERALKTILGGEPAPEADEGLTREQYRTKLGRLPSLVRIPGPDGTPRLEYNGQSLSYGEMTDVCAKAVLDFLEAFPQYADAPGESDYDWTGYGGEPKYDDAGEMIMPRLKVKGLYDLMKENGYGLGELGLTGFMWGFAYNTAKRLRYEDGSPNPAIIEIGG